MKRPTTLIVLCLLAACSTNTSSIDPDAAVDGSVGAPGDGAGSPTPDLSVRQAGPPDLAFETLIAARPYMSKIPTSYSANKSWPLVILLHGYTASGAIQDAYFGVSKIVEAKGFLYAFPDGTKDGGGNRFWNATDACCNFGNLPVDDVAYIDAIIDDMSTKYSVDPKRIFLIGHSNGGFMSHRLACDLSARVAGIVALAGDNWLDVTKCRPTSRVSVLQVHGTADGTIGYMGGQNAGHAYPSAMKSIGSWVTLNGCGAQPLAGTPLDIDNGVPGSETTVESWTGCQAGGAAELWSIQGGGHVPNLVSGWATLIYDWLAAHPKP